MGFQKLVQAWAANLGLSVTRWPPNRFDAMREALILLAARGYAPRVVIDVGANVGSWTEMVSALFLNAAFQLVEPQAACATALARFKPPRFVVHLTAVTAPGAHTVRMIGEGTGARVASPSEVAVAGTERTATTLDGLFARATSLEDRALLKLDVEGHELEVLSGAEDLLRCVEVVIAEVQFYEIEGNGLPVFADVVAAMARRAFVPYDFATLGSRARDRRLRMGDVVFVRRDSPLLADVAWA